MRAARDEPATLDGPVVRGRLTCFLVGPFPGYAQLVGERADAVTFFVGSILFTLGGALQSWLAWPDRHKAHGGRAAWWAAIIQSAGTLFFNVTTFQAMDTALSSPEYNKLVWRPDWRGSVCFLVSGAIAYCASPRTLHRWLPARGAAGWWQPAVNLLGCIFFGISAIAGYVVPSTGIDARPRRRQLEHGPGRPASSPARSAPCVRPPASQGGIVRRARGILRRRGEIIPFGRCRRRSGRQASSTSPGEQLGPRPLWP